MHKEAILILNMHMIILHDCNVPHASLWCVSNINKHIDIHKILCTYIVQCIVIIHINATQHMST
jgi:hypothetical protein